MPNGFEQHEAASFWFPHLYAIPLQNCLPLCHNSRCSIDGLCCAGKDTVWGVNPRVQLEVARGTHIWREDWSPRGWQTGHRAVFKCLWSIVLYQICQEVHITSGLWREGHSSKETCSFEHWWISWSQGRTARRTMLFWNWTLYVASFFYFLLTSASSSAVSCLGLMWKSWDIPVLIDARLGASCSQEPGFKPAH